MASYQTVNVQSSKCGCKIKIWKDCEGQFHYYVVTDDGTIIAGSPHGCCCKSMDEILKLVALLRGSDCCTCECCDCCGHAEHPEHH